MKLKGKIRRHRDHEVVIIPRLYKNRPDPVPGLYCAHCETLIKWLSYDEAETLLSAGVEGLNMLPVEQAEWSRRCQLVQKKGL